MMRRPLLTIAVLTLYTVIAPWLANNYRSYVDKGLATLSNAVIIANVFFFVCCMVYTYYSNHDYEMKTPLLYIIFIPYLLINIGKALLLPSFAAVIDWVGVICIIIALTRFTNPLSFLFRKNYEPPPDDSP